MKGETTIASWYNFCPSDLEVGYNVSYAVLLSAQLDDI